ncbi:rhomboid family intramembrane serine protease [Thermopolyspora sp. NPDC052614]|uniref:rhomboid family intramembrane serine protease n=1 Tax=Thermopolyspora sp. NPDC052614 TaxID=3155682 RepID=UPI003430F0E0
MNDHPGYRPVPRAPGGSGRGRAAGMLAGALGGVAVVLLLLTVMWVLEILDYVVFYGALDHYGIVAHDTEGLVGVVLAPFLHAGFGHLMANSLPLLVLGIMAAIRGVGRFIGATVIITLVSGLGVWLTSPPNFITIGASGLVFGYFGYVVARGLFDRHSFDIALGVVVAVLYYSLLWGVLPNQPGISWQGHLFGLIGGVLAAWLLRRRRPVSRSDY